MRKEKLLTDSYQSIRRAPKNLMEKDRGIFSHELSKNIAPVKEIALANIYVSGSGIVVSKEKTFLPICFSKFTAIIILPAFKFYLHLFNRIIRKRFKIEKQPVTFIAEKFYCNYFHWLTEAFPRLIAGKDLLKTCPVILPGSYSQFPFIEESLKIAGFSFKYLNKQKFYLLENVAFITHFAAAGNYNDHFIQKTREALTTGQAPTRASKLVYISRKNAERRKLINEAELQPVLSNLQFETIYCEDLSLQEQVRLFSQTKVLVSNHGAGLTNMMFMPKGGIVLELRYDNDQHNNCYYSLASALGIDYYYQQCLPVNSELDPYQADLWADKENFAALLFQIIKKL